MPMGRHASHRNRADLEAREVGDDAFERVRQLKDDATSVRYFAQRKMGREALDQPPELAIGDAARAVDYRLALGVASNGSVEDLPDRDASPVAARSIKLGRRLRPWHHPFEGRSHQQ